MYKQLLTSNRNLFSTEVINKYSANKTRKPLTEETTRYLEKLGFNYSYLFWVSDDTIDDIDTKCKGYKTYYALKNTIDNMQMKIWIQDQLFTEGDLVYLLKEAIKEEVVEQLTIIPNLAVIIEFSNADSDGDIKISISYCFDTYNVVEKESILMDDILVNESLDSIHTILKRIPKIYDNILDGTYVND